MTLETTPVKITPAVLRFCDRFRGSVKRPVYVPVRSEPNEKPNDCHNVVQRKVSRDGGASVAGWLIWENPGWYLMSEFHSIWESPAGELIDINPHSASEEEILFLRDPTMKYNGVRPMMRYMPLKNHPTIRNFIAASIAYSEWFPAPGESKTVDAEGRELKARRAAAIAAMCKALATKPTM